MTTRDLEEKKKKKLDAEATFRRALDFLGIRIHTKCHSSQESLPTYSLRYTRPEDKKEFSVYLGWDDIENYAKNFDSLDALFSAFLAEKRLQWTEILNRIGLVDLEVFYMDNPFYKNSIEEIELKLQLFTGKAADDR